MTLSISTIAFTVDIDKDSSIEKRKIATKKDDSNN